MRTAESVHYVMFPGDMCLLYSRAECQNIMTIQQYTNVDTILILHKCSERLYLLANHLARKYH